MSGKLPEEMEREFDELLAFMDFTSTKYWGFGPEHPLNPANVSKSSVEKFGKAKVLTGLRQAINAHLADFQDFSPAQVAELDEELRQEGIVTLTELRRRHSRQYAGIRERGSIQVESEFHLVKDLLEESGPMLADEEREALSEMMRRYERRED